MSQATAIGEVSQSLRNLLRAEMSLNPDVPVTLLGPDEGGANRRINLFLYQVQENASLKNLDWQVKRGDPGKLVPPPLSLNLFYLMTPYAQNDAQTGHSGRHEILGDAMRVFYEHPVVPAEHLTPGLQGAREEVRIMLRALDLEELSRVWATFTQPFRLSVLYEISVVQLDVSAASEATMAPRVSRIGVPDLNGPFLPPAVTGFDPASGPGGTAVTVRGTHLEGWQAYVTVSRRQIVQGQGIAGGEFQFTVPADLDPGFQEVRVDVSHLHRSTFFFEVTP